jgi:cold shock CspA family protein
MPCLLLNFNGEKNMELENFEYGVVRQYDEFKNCGSIDRAHGRGELFFRPQDVPRIGRTSLRAGDRVKFFVILSRKGPKAVRVRRIN